MGNPEEKSTWTEYSQLVLKELERLNEGQLHLQEDLNKKFTDLNEKISKLDISKNDVSDTKVWKERVNDVWSPNQMKETKDEVYSQKNRWAIVTGIVIALQILFSLIVVFKDRFFP